MQMTLFMNYETSNMVATRLLIRAEGDVEHTGIPHLQTLAMAGFGPGSITFGLGCSGLGLW